MRKLLALLVLAFLVQTVSAQPTPNIIDIGKGFVTRGVNDSGNIIMISGSGAKLWMREANTFQDLNALTNGVSAEPLDINNLNQVVGTTRFSGAGFPTERGTYWGAPGGGTDLGATSCPANEGASRANAINDGGQIVGFSTTMLEGNCTGPFPAGGNPLSMLITNVENIGAGSTAENVGPNGTIVGSYPNTSNAGIIVGGSVTPIGFVPRTVLTNGTIVGQGFGASGARVRAPDGTVTNVSCGANVSDANDAGDILTWSLGADGLSIWHDGVCYKLSQVLPDDKPGWTFPSNGSARLNKFGQVATNAYRPGEGNSGFNNTTAVLFTPQYPFSIIITATPTEVPGEYEFESVTTKGTQTGTITWDFGDGSAPTVTGTKTKKKFNKPGTFTVKATAKDVQNRTAVTTFLVTVKPPTLKASISIPDFESGEIPLDEHIVINVTVLALNDGVGDLSELTFQGGTFTASSSDILSYTTAATSPFSLAPGGGNTYPLNVHAAAEGAVELKTVIIGKDAAGQSVSAHHELTVTVSEDAFSSDQLKISVGAVKNGKVPVKLENLNENEIEGTLKLLKGGKPKASGIEKEITKPITFEVPGKGNVTKRPTLDNATSNQVENGKTVKARVAIELTGSLATGNKIEAPVSLSKNAKKKKKKKK